MYFASTLAVDDLTPLIKSAVAPHHKQQALRVTCMPKGSSKMFETFDSLTLRGIPEKSFIWEKQSSK